MNDSYLKGEEHVRVEKQMEVGEFDRALINSIVFNHQMESNIIKCNIKCNQSSEFSVFIINN